MHGNHIFHVIRPTYFSSTILDGHRLSCTKVVITFATTFMPMTKHIDVCIYI